MEPRHSQSKRRNIDRITIQYSDHFVPKVLKQRGWVSQTSMMLNLEYNYTVTSNTRYTVSVWVGFPNTNTFHVDSTGNAYQPHTGISRYRVQLLAGQTVLADDNNELPIQKGWLQSILTADISPDNLNIGQTLLIRLIHTADISPDNLNIGQTQTTRTLQYLVR
eukprot:916957_1